MKGSFKGLIKDYFIAIELHLKTGEHVTKENFISNLTGEKCPFFLLW